jgi:hypothetical protein
MKYRWKFKIAILIVVAVAAMGALVMWLWNWLIPVMFNGPMINFWQALGIMLLCRILFRGFWGMKHRGMYGMHGMPGGFGPWKSHFDKMTPEEKDKMRELWKKRCGGFSGFPCPDDMKTDVKGDVENPNL